jgi:general secretion pathway protein A
MYLEHFRLNLKPFQIDTDQRFLYLSEQHQEALAILRCGILFNRGVLVLTGDVGTGKTILVRTLVETLGPEAHTAVISDPSLRGLDFFNFMAHEIGMETDFNTKGEFLIGFSHFLDSLFEANQNALLILDEAQYLDPSQLEEIRILSDLERENNKRLNIFFVGQNEFNSMIADNRLRALKQRIASHYHLEPLNLKETRDYVRHRLKVAGCHRPLFTPSALKKIFGLTKGYPRLINVLCDLCLLSAFVKDLYEIDPAIVEESAAELMHPSQLNEKNFSPSEYKPLFDSLHHADTQQSAAPKPLPEATTQTTKRSEPPERPKPFALFMQTFLGKPAYLFAVVVLLPALVWFTFKDDQSHSRQASSPSKKSRQESQTDAEVKLIPSSPASNRLDAPQMEHVQTQEPSVSAYKIPPERPLVTTAAVQPDQFASPMVVPSTVKPEGLATPASKFYQDAPAVELPEEDRSKDVARPENLLTQESSLSTHHDSPLKSTDETIFSKARPLSAIPVTSETDSLPVPSAKRAGTEPVAAEVASTRSAPASAPADAPSEINSDQATKSDFVDVPSPSPSESDPSAIINFVLKKRSRQLDSQ